MLTLKQLQVFEFIEHYIAENGYSPTLLEIGFAVGVKAKGTVHRYVQALVQEGVITLLPDRKRNIQLCMRKKNTYSLPLIGKIAAGKPIEAIEDQQVVHFDELFFGKNRFALRVVGDSMIEEGILDGDIVICQRTQTANSGDIVVALIDQNYATLKRIRFNATKNLIMLVPANSALAVQEYSAERVAVQGIFVGLCRLGDRN